jgi:hypothetical protein
MKKQEILKTLNCTQKYAYTHAYPTLKTSCIKNMYNHLIKKTIEYA